MSAPQDGPRPARAPGSAALLVVALFALTGCGLQSLQDLPLPGGAALGPEPYTVTAQFTNVVDLVPNNSVRVNDVPVGVVRDVSLAPDGWTAQVTVEVNGAVVLPANATARLRQTSLLGEKFVELMPSPTDPPQGRLAAGAVIPVDRTDVGAPGRGGARRAVAAAQRRRRREGPDDRPRAQRRDDGQRGPAARPC